jgi:hypothetical protein
MRRPASLSLLDVPARRTTQLPRIGFIDRRTDLAELSRGPKGGQIGASSAPMANTWQYTALEAA